MNKSRLRNALLKRISYSLVLVLSAFATPSAALPIYELTGTLDWNSTSGADRLNLDGEEFFMTFEITDPTPTNIIDPNGTQSYYQGLVALSIGGVTIETDSSQVSFFSHSDSSMEDVANFFLFTTSGDPEYYYPAVSLIPGSNTGASIQPPLYTSDDANRAGLLVPDVEPTGIAATYYDLSSFSFASTIPIPASVWLFGSGLLGLVGMARKKTHAT